MKITCQNCKHTENIELFEYRKNSKMYLTKVMFSFKDLEVVKPFKGYVIICFACQHFTIFSKKLFGLEYVETFKYGEHHELECGLDTSPSRIFDMVYTMAHDTNAPDHVIKKLAEMKKFK